MSSELACISMNFTSFARYSSGHPVGRLDLAAGLDVLEKRLLVAGDFHGRHPAPPSERSLASRL